MTIAAQMNDAAAKLAPGAALAGLAASAPNVALAMHKSQSLYTQALREDGLLPGSLLATQNGWKTVETIKPADMVLTFDNGAQPVSRVHRITVPFDSIPAHKAYVMVVPMGALGNRRELRLLANQEVIIESDMAEQEFGDPFVMIQALMLEGFFGIHRAPIEDDLQIYMVTFASEQVVHIAGAALVTARPESDFSPLSVMNLSETRTYPRLTLEHLRRIAASLKGLPQG